MPSSNFVEQASVYLPVEWRYALAHDEVLPQNAEGAALIADISGFTSLADALVKAFGMRQGAEDVSKYLDQIYTQIVMSVDNYGGSVVGFAGDAITCWFDDILPWTTTASLGARRAAACALEIQAAINRFQSSANPIDVRYLDGFRRTPITVKVAVAC